MNDDQIAKIYLIAYFWLFLAVQSALVYFGTELESPRGIINTAFTYLAFVPLYGYTYDRQIPTRGLWRLFIVLFFLWQIAAFSWLYGHPLKIVLMQILMMLPLFWSLVGYALITVQQDEAKKTAMIRQKDDFKDRSKSFVVIAGALAMLLLMICLFIMLNNYWQTRSLM